MNKLYILLLSLFSCTLFAQKATIQGIVTNPNKATIASVNISFRESGTQTNKNGFYTLEVPANTELTLVFSHISFKKSTLKITLQPNEIFEYNPVLLTDIEQIGEVVINSNKKQRIEGLLTLAPETIRNIPGANPGVENLLQTLPGVSANNELSTQYAVRGGNYDENLVYINEIEVYRPFLIRSGQQEGLSFVNSALTRNVNFSAGGFQAKYGDKLSSVLDITYRRPTTKAATLDASLLGASLSADGVSKNKKFTGIIGLRYRNNSLLVNSRQTASNFNPSFFDAQTYLTYAQSKKLEFSFLGNIAINNYDFKPLSRRTNFGTVANPISLFIDYNGAEKDRYQTTFGALKATYKPQKDVTLRFISSIYHTQEQEFFDIEANYRLGIPNSSIGDEDFGEVEFTRGIGSQLNHARNQLDALFINLEHRGTLSKNKTQIDWGVKYTHEDIRDRLQEFEVIDSSGFSIRPVLPDFSNNEPYEPFTAPLEPFSAINANNEVQIDRFSGFAQLSSKLDLGEHQAWYNIGARAHSWSVKGKGISSNSHIVFSPRGQFSIQPDWESDQVFRISGGLYHQPPLYRELRDFTGTVRPNVKAQQAIHAVISHDWSFKLWERPFKLVSDVYYKSLSNVNTYTLENVRIRYRANNNANAYAYGFDTRLNGEFVPGTDSWISLGVLKTEENQDNRGYIARPTDQRLKLGVLFQDYVPNIPSLRLYINMVYQTGLPGGSPSNVDVYEFTSLPRLPFYFRADAGFSYVLRSSQTLNSKKWVSAFKKLEAGFEIYNIFDRNNSITNTFVRDASTKQIFAVPNFLTARVFNVRLSMRL